MPVWLLPLLETEAPVVFGLIKDWITADKAKDAAALAALEAQAGELIAKMVADRAATATQHDADVAASTARLTPPDASPK